MNFLSHPVVELRKDQLSQVQILDTLYHFDSTQKLYQNQSGEALEIGGKKVTALFPWDERGFLAHVEGRFFHIPALIWEDGSVFRGVPLGIKNAVQKILSPKTSVQKSQTF